MELTVYTHAAFDGKMVRELALPPGCVLVSIHWGLRRIVPTPDTVLKSGDRITAVIAPQAADAVGLLKNGTSP